MPTYTKETVASLIDGKLPWATTKRIMSEQKDPDRFGKILAIHQDRVPWSDTIVLCLGEHLYIVRKRFDEDWKFLVKCECGFEFGEYTENWKMAALIYVRDTEEKLAEIMPAPHVADPAWSVVREYYCPECKTQLEVEAVPPGYPVIFDFLPDIEGFYDAHSDLKSRLFQKN
jgi:acetone carboxylase, gamma subunit